MDENESCPTFDGGSFKVFRVLPDLVHTLIHTTNNVKKQAFRALSHSVTRAIMRTSLVNSGIDALLFAVSTREDGDRATCLACRPRCILANQHSPLRTLLLKQGVATPPRSLDPRYINAPRVQACAITACGRGLACARRAPGRRRRMPASASRR